VSGRVRSDHELGSLGGSNDADSCGSSDDRLDDCIASYDRFTTLDLARIYTPSLKNFTITTRTHHNGVRLRPSSVRYKHALLGWVW
jgi:hypothetical protein